MVLSVGQSYPCIWESIHSLAYSALVELIFFSSFSPAAELSSNNCCFVRSRSQPRQHWHCRLWFSLPSSPGFPPPPSPLIPHTDYDAFSHQLISPRPRHDDLLRSLWAAHRQSPKRTSHPLVTMSQERLREEYEMSAPSTSAGVAGADGNARPTSKESREALSNDKEGDKDKQEDEDKEDGAKEKPAGLGPYFVSYLGRRDKTKMKSPAKKRGRQEYRSLEREDCWASQKRADTYRRKSSHSVMASASPSMHWASSCPSARAPLSL